MQSKKLALLAIAGVLCAVTTPQIIAKEKGDWIIRAGVTHIAPKSDNGSTIEIPDVGVVDLDVDSATMFTFDGTYMISNNFGIELLAALPFKHDVSGSIGSADLGKIATVKHLPPTLSGVFHFNPSGSISPYAGLGVNWTIFFDEEPKGALVDLGVEDLKLTNSLGLAAVVGVDIPLTDSVLLNANVRYMDIGGDVKVDGVKIAKANIDPWVFGINLGWIF
jgi:outer membrane protein